MAKKRLDSLLVERGLAESREKAQALIMAGEVTVGGKVVDKSGTAVPEDSEVAITHGLPYVSRGGLKLEHALAAFRLQVAGAVAVDIGASTGGFTDCLLRNGAARVYAVDVGYGLLHWRLRSDPRVVTIERTNARYLTSLPEAVDLATVDVSFISLTLILPVVARLLTPAGKAVVLVKPQFEAGRGQVGKGGVVRDPAVHRQVLRRFAEWAGREGWRVHAATPSPILGPAGNREFLALLGREGASLAAEDTDTVVNEGQTVFALEGAG
ncbi:MAG: TlyA family RNA methyltransferase [Chloroflexi bacterium]|nr:TlyA family RNA methyltransferase [Chloroflexota bacterium]MCL5109679.1 TlyA family RNA methyltransferase [Chloroflexota bacterium]